MFAVAGMRDDESVEALKPSAANCAALTSRETRGAEGQKRRIVRVQMSVKIPELLAPAGDWECAKAAVENGADAIYFGLERFNARMRANNFTEGGPAEVDGLPAPPRRQRAT